MPNVTALKEEVANHGRVVVAKAYADWVTRSPELKGASQFINDPPALYAAGIEPVYVPTRLPLGSAAAISSRTTRVKNSVDVKMTADCIECAHSYPNIGTYVLVSGDSDFIHVINSLRAIGKRAIIIGVSWSTSRRLADQVDGLILYDTDVDPEIQPERVAPVPSGRSASRSGSGNRQQLSDVMRVIEDIVRAERQAGRTPLLTSLKQRIMRRVPGFDEKKLGFSGFKKLMLRTTEEGNIKLVTVGLVDWVIMADEPIPEEALPETQVGTGAIESVAAEEEVVPVEETASEPAAEEGSEPTAAPAIAAELEHEDEQATADPGAQESEAAPQAVAAGGPSLTAEIPEVEAATPSETDSVTSEVTTETEAIADNAESVELEEATTDNPDPELEQVLEETLAQLELPKGPGDGLDGRRISDLIIMADTLEHQESISHVAFNFLLAEICGALQQGLEAEHPEITGRWGGRIYSRTYVTRLLRELGEKDVFVRDWHLEKNEETGRSRRFRTFNLNRSHPLVKRAVVSQWGAETDRSQQDFDVNSTGSLEADSSSASKANEVGAGTSRPAEMPPADAGTVVAEAPEGEEPEPDVPPKRKTRRAPSRRGRQTAKAPAGEG